MGREQKRKAKKMATKRDPRMEKAVKAFGKRMADEEQIFLRQQATLSRWRMQEALDSVEPIEKAIEFVQTEELLIAKLSVQLLMGNLPRLREQSGNPSLNLACKPGCDACCSYRVAVSVPEVLVLAAHVARHFTAEQRTTLRERLDHAPTVQPGYEWKAAHRCALLVDGRCSVYSARPIACVGMNSFDAKSCAEGKGRSQAFVPQLFLAGARQQGLLLGQHDAGCDASPVELAAALRIALDDPQAGDKWRSGQPVFASAIAHDEMPRVSVCTACKLPVMPDKDGATVCPKCRGTAMATGVAALAVMQASLIPSLALVRENPNVANEIGLMVTQQTPPVPSN
jgi:hypothetical protein